MGLVDYSESESSASESEAPVKPTTKAPPKKPAFQKVVDRSNPGKIIVSLPQPVSSSAIDTTNGNEPPPAKRARTGGSGGAFSGFNSFLPPPKNTGKLSKPTGSQARPSVNLKTSAEKGFSRDEEFSGGAGAGIDSTASGGLSLPPPKRSAEPSVPEDMKPAEEVKLVGKPLMFRPLSVAKNTKKKTTKPAASKAPTTSSLQQSTQAALTAQRETQPAAPPKKTSLFSLHTEEPSMPSESAAESGGYEPLFETGTTDPLGDYSQHTNYGQSVSVPSSTPTGGESLDTIANDLNLSAAERRELFGRGGSLQTAKKVINFNMDQEYRHNEEVRASGEQQMHNPVRAIQNGKHSLQQLVQNVSNQREALEDSFAKGRHNKREASSRYGW